ncbi:P-loop containing nucleoside triphosphate hydrolase protein [Melampsora americana]|nr:P-loop containing nucleoside triphosphate hydrolase protein [Melampsora americana]
MTNNISLDKWFKTQLRLLRLERDSEKVEFDLLTSDKVKQGQTKLLERMGISIGGLGVKSTSIGLGGKTTIELERPAQYHTDPKIPYHTFRPGLPAGIIDHDLSSGKAKGVNTKTSKLDKITIIEGVVSKVSDTSITLFLSSNQDSNPPELPARCRIIKLADTGTFDRLENTIETLRISCEAEGIIEPSEDGQKDKTDSNNQDPLESIDIPTTTPENALVLNESQQRAVRHALSPAPITLVFGPPGTGKTHTLVSIISALYARGDRILIAAASNLAIDNIAERLLAKQLPLTRLGHPARVLDSLSQSTLDHQCNTFDGSEIIRDLKVEINGKLNKLSAQGKDKLRGKARSTVYMDIKDLRKDYRQRERKHTDGIIKQARIVCATTHGAGSRQLENQVFDVVIIDESTQAFEAACWIPILKSKSKVILAGDPLQLPPTIKSNKHESDSSLFKVEDSTDPETKGKSTNKAPSTRRSFFKMNPPKSLEVTMFDRLLKSNTSISCLLDVQYRMHSMIMEFPSKQLYKGRLKAAESVAAHLLKDLSNVSESDSDGIADPVLFIDTAGSHMHDRIAEEGGDGSVMNENEANLVVKQVTEFLDAGLLPEQIMVLSPYSAQVALLSSLLKSLYPTLAIGSIDSCQGRENEAVILSLVRSNTEGVVGFLHETRRLNVAMTRAKRNLTIIGDSDTLSKGGEFLKKWMDWLETNAEVRVADS